MRLGFLISVSLFTFGFLIFFLTTDVMASSGSKDGQLQIKVVLLGAASVGKTCLVSRYVHDRFTSNYQNVSGLFINNFVKYLWYIRDMLFMSLGTSFTCCSRRSLCMLTMEIGPVSSMLKLLIKLILYSYGYGIWSLDCACFLQESSNVYGGGV